jgi:hypothetical protein
VLTADGSARRQAWLVIYLLGGALAVWASLGIDHTFRTAHAGYAHCAVHRTAVGCGSVLAHSAPLRPLTVWIFAGVGVALLACAAAVLLRPSKPSVEGVLGRLQPVAQ